MERGSFAMTALTRITLDPEVMGGKPCIRGLRITVGTIVGLVASGRTVPEMLIPTNDLNWLVILASRAATWLTSSRHTPSTF
jgi:uncharacterized protein (DUF433 family)